MVAQRLEECLFCIAHFRRLFEDHGRHRHGQGVKGSPNIKTPRAAEPRSMSSIKRDVKKKLLPRPEWRFFLEIQPTFCECPTISLEGFCSGLSVLPVGFIFRW